MKTEKWKMKRSKPWLRFCVGSAVVLSAALCLVTVSAFGQAGEVSGGGGSYVPGPEQKKPPVPIVGGFDKVHPLPPGGPAPRMSDGHVDLTGRWYPNAAGKMLQFAYPLDLSALRQFNSKTNPEVPPVFKPGMEAKYKRPVPYGDCDQAGTPSTVLEQDSQHAPMELIGSPQRLVMLFEYPLDVRMVYFNRQHEKDPDPTFNGDTTAHWEGDTLVLDVIGIDERMRVFGGEGTGGWFPSDQERITERITRTSKNYLTYQITVEDPVVLAKPWKSAVRTWTLAQDPHDEWGEVFCTLNEEPSEYKKITDAKAKNGGK
jgi:hypothetical protein